MTRWEKAIEKLPSIDKYEIMTEMCPFSVFEDGAFPACDHATVRRMNEGEIGGCRGITCEQCWKTEIPED